MSEKAAVGRKEKRAQRDAERHKGGKKRKREEDAPEEEPKLDFVPLTSDAAADTEPEAKLKAPSDAEAQQPKSKKRRKAKKTEKPEGEEASTTKSRFILFIGNLPYSTTDASLQSHFKSIAPFTLRHRTDPKTKKSKGFAFLEFENYDRMQTCIKLYHHSMFNADQLNGDGAERRGKDRGARRINVELTAGGGGSKEGRMEKIKAKNVKLDEQRKRRAEAERKEKEKQLLKEEKEGKGKDSAGKKDGKDAKRVDAQLQEKLASKDEDRPHVHPSRLARVMG